MWGSGRENLSAYNFGRSTSLPQLEKPNCLNVRTKDNMKRFEVLEMLKDITFLS